MARKFNSHRVYLLARGVVVVVSAISLVWGGALRINQGKSNDEFLDMANKCYAERSLDLQFTCGVYYDMIEDRDNFIQQSLALGIVLPILFFGGKALLTYIFPEETKKKAK
jgi:hypothetical protein